jgi:hypothetical protein
MVGVTEHNVTVGVSVYHYPETEIGTIILRSSPISPTKVFLGF